MLLYLNDSPKPEGIIMLVYLKNTQRDQERMSMLLFFE